MCLNVPGLMFRDFFHYVSHFQLPTLYITITASWKIILYPSAGTVGDPVWTVLLAVSVSQFGLSVILNQVRHYQFLAFGNFLPSQPEVAFTKALHIMSVRQLHMNSGKRQKIWYKAQIMDNIQIMQLTEINFLAYNVWKQQKHSIQKYTHMWYSRQLSRYSDCNTGWATG